MPAVSTRATNAPMGIRPKGEAKMMRKMMTTGHDVRGAKSTPSSAAILEPKSSHANQLVAAKVMVGSCHENCSRRVPALTGVTWRGSRSEEHTSELQSRFE